MLLHTSPSKALSRERTGQKMKTFQTTSWLIVNATAQKTPSGKTSSCYETHHGLKECKSSASCKIRKRGFWTRLLVHDRCAGEWSGSKTTTMRDCDVTWREVGRVYSHFEERRNGVSRFASKLMKRTNAESCVLIRSKVNENLLRYNI